MVPVLIYKIFDFLTDRRTGTVFAFIIIATFFTLSFTRSYPFQTFEAVLNDIGNDWSVYARQALDISANGILMPSVDGPYYFPAGYLYNYFIALCLTIFGIKILPIYIAQNLMLGLSTALVYWAFRDKMKKLTAAVFLCVLFVFAFKDVYKNYSPLLLSENLALFTVSLFFFCFIRGFERDNFPLQLMAAFAMGLSILARPNIVLFGALLVPIVLPYYIKRGKRGIAKLLVFCAVFILCSSLLAVRNYMACKKILFLPQQVSSMNYIKSFNPVPASVDLSRADTNFLYSKLRLNKDVVDYVEYMRQRPADFFKFYFKKIIFCLGYLPVLSPGYALRMRWVLMWMGYAVYLLLHIKNREKFRMWETAVHLYIFCYYGSLVMSASVHNYGFRMLIPGIFFVLPFAFMAIDKACSRIVFRSS